MITRTPFATEREIKEGQKMERRASEKEETWSSVEDEILVNYVQVHGDGNWRDLPKRTGLNRSGKSCKHRWFNYLVPTIHRGNISSDEEELIIRLHNLLGNRWSMIAGRLPGRTENEIENFWNNYLSKKKEMQKDTSITTTLKKPSVQYLRCMRNPLDTDPAESPHPIIKPKAVRLTKATIYHGNKNWLG